MGKFNILNLLVLFGAQHMWRAATERKSCNLTAATQSRNFKRCADFYDQVTYRR